ncbi:hypothetical protein [Paenibacillus montanisoli]|uniref:Thymidylate kinase n=1 Tax=Paenibacillus montanisoli TaxID=2081970 RepID=A0A328TZP6_9BACL|nr:hypothetical protein [Paenibacillus montanisoli]RAP74651.1 hypothetical protein DL346_21620 [Paenibacillus montanisoli]
MPKRLIIIDGIPGSGKTTTASRIAGKLAALGIHARKYLELEEAHPLMLTGIEFGDLHREETADRYSKLFTERYSDFVEKQLSSPYDVILIESVMFQDTINVAHLMGMPHDKLLRLCMQLQETVLPLNPALIYYYHHDVEGQWRHICGIRGNEWGPVSLHTDEDFKHAGEVWERSQAFVRAAIDFWDIPKLIIENRDYLWQEYDSRIDAFVDHLTKARLARE